MNKPAPRHRWYAPWPAWRSPAVAEADPADLGTAFGLDLSLALAEGSEPAWNTAGADARRSGWVQRWVARRRAAT